jgi:transcriptional regulator with XRE-family HTH domain
VVPSKSLLRHLGACVRERREELGLTQEVLAASAGIHLNTIGQLERGSYNPSVLLLDAVATKLDLSLAELFRRATETR